MFKPLLEWIDMIPEGDVILGIPKRIDRDVFFSNKDEEALDSFIIAVAAWFNDLKTYQLHAIQAEERAKAYIKAINDGKKPNKKEEMEGRLATSQFNHASRLMAAHVVEILESIKMNEEILKHPIFIKAVDNIPKDRQIYLEVIVRCATDSLGPADESGKFVSLKKLFVRMRASGTYHYNKLKYFKKGYQHYFEQPGNEPYYCLAESPGGTRFFFADRVQEEILQELVSLDAGAINDFSSVAQHAVKDLVVSYISVKEQALKKSRIANWTFRKVGG
jgi:hypothetical protein